MRDPYMQNKANSKRFQFSFTSAPFIVIGKFYCPVILYEW